MYIDCSCGFFVVCEELEDDAQEWSTCGFDCIQFNKNKKDTSNGIKRLFYNLFFNSFRYKLDLDVVADNCKPWLKDPVDIERNNNHIAVSNKEYN